MIACDDQSCRYEWFHFSCVNVTAAPSGDWLCPDCRWFCICKVYNYNTWILSNVMYAYYRHATTGSPRLVKALHTISILSMLATSYHSVSFVFTNVQWHGSYENVVLIHKSNNPLNMNPNFWQLLEHFHIFLGELILATSECQYFQSCSLYSNVLQHCKPTIGKHNISRFKKRLKTYSPALSSCLRSVHPNTLTGTILCHIGWHFTVLCFL